VQFSFLCTETNHPCELLGAKAPEVAQGFGSKACCESRNFQYPVYATQEFLSMGGISFEEYWSKNWAPTSQPAAFELAMREIAFKAWNAAIQSASGELVKSDSDIRLMAGEMSAGEMRTTKAVLAGCSAAVLRLTYSS
jgi:hypothetical protein